jgi:hypothetical protein
MFYSFADNLALRRAQKPKPPRVIHMQIAGLRAHAALRSCGAPEHGIPLSCTQPGGGGGHGLPSGVTHDGHTGAAWAGAAKAMAVEAIAAAPALSPAVDRRLPADVELSHVNH